MAVELVFGAAPPAVDIRPHAGALSTGRLNTLRQAQRLLTDEGMLEPRRGVGVFVVATSAQPAPQTLLAQLKDTRAALDRAIAALERTGDHG